MKIEKVERQPVFPPNEKHLAIKEVREVSNLKVPNQTIRTYFNAFVTRTNFLFVKGVYIKSGLLVGDNKELSFFKQLYLYVKYRYAFKVEKHSGLYLWYYDLWSANYYHWICETLPRLFELKSTFEHGVIVLPDNYKKHAFIVESLAILKMEVCWVDPLISHAYEHLITIETTPSHADVNPVMQKKLIDKLLHSVTSDIRPFRKIYLSRKRAAYRKITNEDEIIDILKSLDYEVVIAEELSFQKQIQLFREALVVVAQHGAGITNMSFMQKHTKVLEIRNEGWNLQPLCFWRLANIQEIYWTYFIAQSISTPSNISDMEVEISDFKEVVTQFCS